MSRLSSTQEFMIQMHQQLSQERCKPSQQALTPTEQERVLNQKISSITGKNMAIKKRHEILRKQKELFKIRSVYQKMTRENQSKSSLLLSDNTSLCIDEKAWIEDILQLMDENLNKELDQLNAIILS